jgi:PAS domain S-box-containing protein
MGTSVNPYGKFFLVFVATGIGFLILVNGYFYLRHEQYVLRKERYNELKAIVDLKIDQIMTWRHETFGYPYATYRNSFFEDNIENFIFKGRNEALKNSILEQFSVMRLQSGYENIFLTSPSGELLFAVDATLKAVDLPTKKFIAEAVVKQKVSSTDLFYCSLHRKIHYDIVVPVMNRNNVSIASIVFRVDPAMTFYPIVQSWPTPSKTSEILIIRKSDDSVLFLSELRFRKNSALKLKFPLTNTILPAAQAVLGYEGFLEGKDYRNAEVLSYLCKLPGTPWFMVAKVDRKEVFSELNYRAATVMIVVIVLIILVSVTISRFYYSRQRNIYRELFLNEKRLVEMKEEYRTMLYSIGDGVITTDTNGIIRHMNPVAEKLTGWMEAEAKGIGLNDVFRLVQEKTNDRIDVPFERVIEEGAIANIADKAMIISTSGMKTPAAGNYAPIFDVSKKIIGGVLVFQDQENMREAGRKLENSEVRYRRLFETAKNGMLILNAETGSILDVNPFLVEMLGYSHDHYVGKNMWDLGCFRNIADSREKFLELQHKRYIRYEDIPLETFTGKQIDVEFISNVYEVDQKKVIQCNIRDITERKLAEVALKESSNKIRSLAENIPGYVAYVNADTLKYEFVNDAFIKSFQIAHEKIIGSHLSEFFPNPAYQDTLKHVEAVKTGKSVTFESVFHLDGYQSWFEIHFAPVFDANMHVSSIVMLSFNITERKQAENALKESESRYRNLVELLQTGIVLHDEGIVIFANSAAANIMNVGRSGAMITGKPILDYIHPDYRETIQKRIIYSLEENTAVPLMEAVFLRNDGSPITVEVTSIPFLFQGKKVMLSVFNDISRRKEAEEALGKSLAMYKLLSENMTDIVWLMDFNLKVNYISPSAFILRGFTVEELMELPLEKQLAPESLAIAMSALQQLLQELSANPGYSDIPTYEFEFYRKDGSTVWLENTFSIIRDINGVPVSILGEGRDITERRQIQEKIKNLNTELEQRVIERTAALQAINRELEAFSYSVSHDLRAPLRAIDGFTSILVEDYEPNFDDEGKKLCARIKENTQKMGQLIDDLLAFSRLGRRDITLSRINMKGLAGSVYKELTTLKMRHEIDFQLGELDAISGDRVLLHQVWYNLIANAIKFSSHCEQTVISISGYRDKNRIVYCVRDHGAGFDMKYIDKLFGVFQRLHSVKEFEGTGVGLAIVQRIINRHGGEVWAEGEVGEGAAFYFALPVKAIGGES